MFALLTNFSVLMFARGVCFAAPEGNAPDAGREKGAFNPFGIFDAFGAADTKYLILMIADIFLFLAICAVLIIMLIRFKRTNDTVASKEDLRISSDELQKKYNELRVTLINHTKQLKSIEDDIKNILMQTNDDKHKINGVIAYINATKNADDGNNSNYSNKQNDDSNYRNAGYIDAAPQFDGRKQPVYDFMSRLVDGFNNAAAENKWRDFRDQYKPIAINKDTLSESESFIIGRDIVSTYFWGVKDPSGNRNENCYVVPSLQKVCGGEMGFDSAGIKFLFDNTEGKLNDVMRIRLQIAAVFELEGDAMPRVKKWAPGILR